MARRRKGQPVHGWLILDKPLGLGSTSAVGQVRRLFNAEKAGHAGTLDPLASGILPIALGEATQTVPFLQDAGKTYRFTIRWGEATATDDREGAVTATHDHRPTHDAIRAVLADFLGLIDQMPPAYSALKIDGQRAYDLARAGETVELAARPVRIDALTLLGCPDADHADFEVRCGKGTYVRSLARDIAARLGTVGHVSALRRCAVGPFDESRAITLDKLLALGHSPGALECLLPIQTALDDIPALAIGQAEADALRRGQPIPWDLTALPGESPAALLLACLDSQAVALVASDGHWLRPTRVFNLPT